MKKKLSILLSLIPLLVYGQSDQPLSEILWERVNHCYVNFEDMDGDGTPDFDKIDDSRNGYLMIEGGWPTCGCDCRSTVGAYKNSKGEYTILQSDRAMCSWEKKVSSNRALSEVLPPSFGLQAFGPITKETFDYPAFFIDVEIPRIGTDTKARVELVPFGIVPEGDHAVCYEYKEIPGNKMIYAIGRIADELSDANTITYLLNGDFDNISAEDQKLISYYIDESGESHADFVSKTEIQRHLIRLKKIYNVYYALDTFEVTLGWDREAARFYVKEKRKPVNHEAKMPFIDFLKKKEYWQMLC